MCRTQCVKMKVMDPGARFEEHINTAHPFECEHCDLRYVEEEKLRKHKRSHQKGRVKEERKEILAEESVKERREEEIGTMDKPQLKDASKSKGLKKISAPAFDLPKSREELPSKSVIGSYWKCNHCEAPFPTEFEMRSHEEKPHGQSCSACSMSFIHAIDFKRHLMEKHNAAGKGITKCDLCNEPTEVKSLSSHKKARHAFKCDQCSLKFVQKPKLWKHMIEEHHQGTWVNRPPSQSNTKLGKSHALKSPEHHPSIPKWVEGTRALQAVKRKDEKIVPRKVSKVKEEKWETVKDKKVKANESREKVEGAKVSTLGAKTGNPREKPSNAGVKPSTLGLKTSTLGLKASDTGAKTTNSEAREKKQSKEVDGESERLEECSKCKEVCSFNTLFIIQIVFPFCNC